jgi:hypothetical protein
LQIMTRALRNTPVPIALVTLNAIAATRPMPLRRWGASFELLRIARVSLRMDGHRDRNDGPHHLVLSVPSQFLLIGSKSSPILAKSAALSQSPDLLAHDSGAVQKLRKLTVNLDQLMQAGQADGSQFRHLSFPRINAAPSRNRRLCRRPSDRSGKPGERPRSRARSGQSS